MTKSQKFSMFCFAGACTVFLNAAVSQIIKLAVSGFDPDVLTILMLDILLAITQAIFFWVASISRKQL